MTTDSELQQDVIAELKWEPAVNATSIGVEVKDGVVTLVGEVSSYAEKLAAEQAAQRVHGLRALATEITVKLASSHQRSDSDIAHTVANVLSWTVWVPEKSIKVTVEHGRVTLSGIVDWQFQKQAATESVRLLLGVTGVNNQIAVKPRLSANMVVADIEAALKRSALADAKEISVSIKGNDVTLSGKVHSCREREAVAASAWNTPGVHSVLDKMTLDY